MAYENEVTKCLDVTASLVVAAIESGKFDAKDGQSVADFFGVVYAQVSECLNLTSDEFVKRWNARCTQG